ncbi:MAG: SusC/RagA family TonB-linked outer membrane protein, partial [Muribaculaceae bacterium]|nr:SusC/RagA family TonB-linked outer membrane protein [Muribaculaceae bacterium]
MSLKHLLLFLVMALATLGVNAQINGTVLDENNEPVIGASVVQQTNPKNGVATDIDGHFTLNVPAGTKIKVTYVGYEEVVVAAKAGMTIVLSPKGEILNEVVVTGYQKVDTRLFTGATQRVDAEKTKLSGVADVSRGLEGRVSGVQVQNVSGTFGTAPKIRVRGATSIYGSSKPLWVVDGVVLEDNVDISADELSSGDANTLIASAVAGLNADDIESFQILKDGSATSIYGAKANAGVIVITTKTGRKGSSSINYTGEFTYRLKPNYRDFNICTSQEQMSILREMEQKGWLEYASLVNSSTSGIYGQMYDLINTYDPETGQYALPNTQAARNNFLREAEFRNTDWFDLLFNNNVMQNHSVSISGGTDKGSFYTSASVMLDPGWYKSSRVERYTFNANAIYNITDKLKLKILNSDSFRDQKAPGTLSQNVDVVYGEVRRDFDINPYSFALNTARTVSPEMRYNRNYTSFNIFDELDQNSIDLNVTDLKFQGELNYKPIVKQDQTLEFNILGSMRVVNSEQNHYVMDNSNMANAYRAGIDPENAIIRSSNSYLYSDPDVKNGLPETILDKGGILFYEKNQSKTFSFRASGQYMKDFHNGDHILSLFAGMEAVRLDRFRESFDAWGVVYANGYLPYTNYKLFKQLQEENGSYYGIGEYHRRDMAYFANANYALFGRYILNGTIRYEGSNQMGRTTQNRWLPTWNVSAAWNISDEPFFQNSALYQKGALSYAKLRLSYSLTAESGPMTLGHAEALYYPTLRWRQEHNIHEMALYLSGLGNSDLTYEKKNEFDLGVDLGFLFNRINVVFDWFTRNNFDLIGRIRTEGVGGETEKFGNVAEMKSHGVEFTITSHNIQPKRPKDFGWTTDLTFSYADTKITKLQARSRVIDLVVGTGFALQGYPHRAIFSIPFAGLDEHGLPLVID